MGNVKDSFSEGLSSLSNGISALGSGISKLQDKMSEGLNSLGNSIIEWFKKLWEEIKAIPEHIKDLKDSIFGILKNIFDFVSDIPAKFKELFIELFVPTFNPVTEVKDKVNEKFGFISQMVALSKDLFTDFDSNATPPSFTISYMGGTYEIVNFKVIEPYRAILHSIIIAICYIQFVLWFFKFAPRIIKGGG